MKLPVRLSGLFLCTTLITAGCARSRRAQSLAVAPTQPPASQGVDNSDLFLDASEERKIEALARFATGIVRDMNQEPDQALDEFYRAAMADPANELLTVDVARRFLQDREPEKALDLLKKSSSRPDASGLVYSWMGRAYDQLGRTDDAIAANRTAIRKTPRNIQPYQNLAKLYLQNRGGDVSELLRILDEAGAQADLESSFLIDLAELYATLTPFWKDNPDQIKRRIVATLDRAALIKSSNPRLLEKLADGYKLMGETNKALQAYLQLLEQYPDWPNLREKLAEIYLRTEDRERAAEQFEAIIRSHPTNPAGYYYLGAIAQLEKNFAKAAENFERALLLNPENLRLYFEVAGVYLSQERSKDALALLEKARSRFPQSFELEFYTALTHQQMKNYPQAINHYTAAEIQAQATDPQLLTYLFYFQAGSAYERNQDIEQAEKYLQKSLELSPDFADALNYLGYMWAERGVHLEKAHAMIDKAVQEEPKNAAFLDSLAWVHFKMGQPKEALPYLLKALEYSDEPDATLLDHLGDIYAELQEEEKAHEAWQKSLEVEPNDQIRKKLEAAKAGRSTAQ